LNIAVPPAPTVAVMFAAVPDVVVSIETVGLVKYPDPPSGFL